VHFAINQEEEVMDTQSRAATQLLETLSFVNTLRETTGGVNVLHALLETSSKEWENSKDANTDTHLIKGVHVNSKKTDAIHVYIAKLVAQHMRSVGNRLTAWTKATIASENHTNVAVSNRVATADFDNHQQLFKMVAGRLMGYDDAVIDIALADGPRARAEALVAYLATRFDLAEDRNAALEGYASAVEMFEVMFDGTGFTPEYFLKTIGQVIAYYKAPVTEGTILLDNPLDLLDALATDSQYDNLLSCADALLGVSVHTVILDKDDADPVGTIAEVRKIFGENVKIVTPSGELDLGVAGELALQSGGTVETKVKGVDEIIPAGIRSTLIG
jgi:hypothetical protein